MTARPRGRTFFARATRGHGRLPQRSLLSTPSHSALEDLRMPVQAKLAAAWTSFMFLCIYVDYFHLYKPGAIDQIRGGVVFV